MIYRVQVVPQPIVIDADGLPVANSHIVEITFPGDAIETALGRVNTIADSIVTANRKTIEECSKAAARKNE